MRYFIAIFCSPLACLLAPAPLAAFLNCFLYVGSFFGLFFFIGPGVLLWLLGVIHAWFVISNKKADRRAEGYARARA